MDRHTAPTNDEARQALEHLELGEARFRSILENMSEGVMLFDAAGDLVYQNPGALRIHGFDRAVDGRIAHDRLPVTWKAWDETGRPVGFEEWPVSRVLRGERFQHQVLRVERLETGRVFHGSFNGSPIRDAAGDVVLGFITIRDITEQVRAEQEVRAAAQAAEAERRAARAAEERMRAVVDNLPSGLVVADLATGHLHWNAEALRIHGYTGEGDEHRFLESLVAEHDLRTLAGEPIAVHRWPLPRVLAGEAFRDCEVLVRNTRLGWERVFSYSGVVLREGGTPALALLAIQDVSARSRAEVGLRAANERLVEADRRKDEFLGMLSHELRNPLAPIRNALFILDHARPEGQQARRAKDIAGRQVAHLTRLVDDLLDVTRIARGKVELRREDLDLSALVQRTAEDYRPLMQDRGLDLALDLPRAPLRVNGDPARLTQVFGNLLNNAAKFTPAGGRVTLSLGREGDRAVTHVADSGPGIAADLLPRLFEPFTQGEQTLARTEGGLGLGLSLVKGLVRMHGGEVAVTSREQGGADFAVALPLAARAAAEEVRAGAPRAQPAAPRHRVLVVDDNRDAAESLGELVQMLGHDVDLAYDGPSAIAEAAKTHPDVVLCDIGLPGMDGYQVARELRARHEGALRLVALSGYAQPEDVARALDAGFDQHVAKPPDPSNLDALLT
jgi:PAS domain S-box-containing protein